MDIAARFVDGVAILDLEGRLVVGADESATQSLRSIIRTLIAQGCIRLTLNLSRLASIDAWGLGELAVAYSTVRRAGGELTLVAPTPRVRRMLAVTRLDSVLTVRESEAHSIHGTRRGIAATRRPISLAVST